MKISYEMRRVLKKLAKGANSPYGCQCSIRTFMALEGRKLIRVDTTLGSIAFPQNARAVITDSGRALLTAAKGSES